MSAHLREDDPVHVYAVTQRCETRCGWSPLCRGKEGSDLEPGEGQPAPPPGRWRARLSGGNAFRYGSLERWAEWVRNRGCVSLELEGPAHGLATRSALERVRAVEADRVLLAIPTTDPSTLEGWTRCRDIGIALERSLDAARLLPIVPRVPIDARTVTCLAKTVSGILERFGPEREILLVRAGDPHFSELPELASELAKIDLGVRLRFDRESGYAPCLVPAELHRPRLFPVARGQGETAVDDACRACAWRPRCAFRERGAPVRALPEPVVLALQATGDDLEASHVPGVTRWDRRELDLPDLVCFAPFTSLVATDPTVPAVPCALSWVRTAMTDDELASETGLTPQAIRELDASARARFGYSHFTPMNDALSLEQLWNSPLLRVMRRQMAQNQRTPERAGGATDRCRPMCRVLLGVEERELHALTAPDDAVTPEVRDNRRRLLDEIREGRERMSARPLKLVYGVSSHCNISCGFCVGPEGAYGELSEKRYDEIVEWLPALMNLDVIGPGEPLMSVRFPRLLEHIADHGYPSLRVSITTNGTLVTPSWVKRHASVRFGNLRISLNAGSAATHERMTGKKLFDRVIAGIEALAAERARTGVPERITLSCVLSDLILGDLGRFAAIVERYGCDIVLEPMNGDRLELSPYTKEQSLERLRDECAALAAEYRLRNPAIARAFAGMVDFSQSHLRSGRLTVLPHH